MLHNNNELYLVALRLVARFSGSLHTTSWVWGGFTMDVYENRILREHDDVDYLTLHLHTLIPGFITLFESIGWRTRLLSNGDLKIETPGLKIHLGHVEFSDRVRWTHDGENGSLWFPREWLCAHPRRFYDLDTHVVEPEFQYVMLERPQMLNPEWTHRDKDLLAREYLRLCVERKGIRPQSLLEQVSSSGLT